MIENETEKLISQIRNKITRSEIYQEYISLKTALLNSGYLEEDVKKIITSDYISLPTEKRREYAKIKMESFNNDPLLHNYFISKEENENLLEEISEFLDL